MKMYCVQVIEQHLQDTNIEAESAEQARQLVVDGGGDLGEIHYSHTLDSVDWPVFEIK